MATQLSQYIEEGIAEFRALGMMRPDGIPSSPHFDAKLITWHCLYHTGDAPKSITTGRGHNYNIELAHGVGWRKVRITDYTDHRNGIVFIA